MCKKSVAVKMRPTLAGRLNLRRWVSTLKPGQTKGMGWGKGWGWSCKLI